MHNNIDKIKQLKYNKNLALGLLIISTLVFAVSHFIPNNFYPKLIKAIAEAAMIGALADWFAVEALFRNPIPFFKWHTAIIPNNRDKISQNLSAFIKEKFFNPQSIQELISKNDFVNLIAQYLAKKQNSEFITNYMLKSIQGFIKFTNDKYINRLINIVLKKLIKKNDITKVLVCIIEILIQNKHHEVIIDEFLKPLVKYINNQENQTFITNQIIKWLKIEHSVKEKILPSEWIGETVANIIIKIFNTLLQEISQDKNHYLRQEFNLYINNFMQKLKNDKQLITQINQIKNLIFTDKKVQSYVGEIYASLINYINNDITNPNSIIKDKIILALQWLADIITSDRNLRFVINNFISAITPDFAEFITKHIKITIQNWDSKDMSRQIEINIGKDLQYIRINGTIVGAIIGGILYGISNLIQQSLFW